MIRHCTKYQPLRIVALIAIIAFAAGCSHSNCEKMSSVEQEVVLAALAGIEDSSTSAKRGLLDTTSTQSFWGGKAAYSWLADQLKEEANGRDQTFQRLVEEFVNANQKDRTFCDDKPLSNQVAIIKRLEARRIYAEAKTGAEAASVFKSRFDGIEGAYEISWPAVDSEHGVALTCLSYYGGPMSGGGRFYVLRFDGKKWIVQTHESFGPSYTP
jgi:hypothetical protein